MLDAERFASQSVEVCPFGVLSDLVDTAGSNSVIRDFELDEAVVTPPCAPGVLNDPVRDALLL